MLSNDSRNDSPSASARDRADAGLGVNDLVVVANRLPVNRVEGAWQTSPGGLVRAMLGVLRDRGGAWVGWDGDVVDAPGGPTSSAVPDDLDRAAELHELADVRLVSVPLTADEFLHHYERISNGALWPLFHDAIRDSSFPSSSWMVYRDVNERFAAAAADAAAPGATVWIHDYQLMLVPQLLRIMRPDVSIGFFLHIPFPPQELFMRMPWREELLEGMLGADLIGFQRRVGADNFVGLAKRLLDARSEPIGNGDSSQRLLLADGRTVRTGTFPVSIDVDEVDRLADAPDASAKVARIRSRLGDPDAIFLGVDRLDYTKGIDLRLSSFGALLRRRADEAAAAGRPIPDQPAIVLVQIAVPGREGVENYAEERRLIDQLVGEINGEHATIGHPAVHYIRRGLPLDDLIPLYLAADVMLVTPRRDGMNLVAKEFVAARRDDSGVLILSEFAGAADELTDAVLVNPHDPDAIGTAMEHALVMTAEERAARMAALRKVVAEHDVHWWAQSFMRALGSTSGSEPAP